MDNIKQQVNKNKTVIMFILIMILMIILAYWVSNQLIDHIDRHIPKI